MEKQQKLEGIKLFLLENKIKDKENLLSKLDKLWDYSINYIYDLIFAKTKDEKISVITKHLEKQQEDIKEIQDIVKEAKKFVMSAEIDISEIYDSQEADKILDNI